MRLDSTARISCICAAFVTAILTAALAQSSLPNAATPRPNGSGQPAQAHLAVIALPVSANDSVSRQSQNSANNSQQAGSPPNSAPAQRGQ